MATENVDPLQDIPKKERRLRIQKKWKPHLPQGAVLLGKRNIMRDRKRLHYGESRNWSEKGKPGEKRKNGGSGSSENLRRLIAEKITVTKIFPWAR